MKPDRTTKVKAVYNSKFGQWRLCHDGWCAKGETSIVATITGLGPDDADAEAWAKELEHRFNLGASG
jgi:hypothetical protein